MSQMTRRPRGLSMRLFCRVPAALCALAWLASGTAHAQSDQAQNYPQVAPQTLPPHTPAPPAPPPLPGAPPSSPAAQKVILPSVKALVFVPAIAQVVSTGREAQGVVIEGLRFLDDADFRAVVAPFIGRPLTMARLGEITRAVVGHCRDRDHPLIDVVVPEQDVDNGVLQLAVVEFKLGQIRVEGNNWFASEVLAGEVRLKPGDPIIGSRLLVDQTVLNENPFRQVDVIYERGRDAGSTDLVLKTVDRLPLHVYAGYDDAGTAALGPDRVNAGFVWGNVFGLDHQFSYQFTASTDLLAGNPSLPGRPDEPRFVSHAFNYTLPLPDADRLTIFGLYARAVPRLAEGFDQLGLTGQASFRYSLRLPRPEALSSQDLQLGYDFKTTNNNLAFGGTAVNATATEIDQGVAQYSATLADRYGSTTATGLFYASPGGVTGGNNSAVFETARAGAKADYVYGQLALERSTPLPKLAPIPEGSSWWIKGTLQRASAPLLPSEELGLGGVGSVRGYDPYTVLGDDGWLLSNELRAPAFSLVGVVREEPWMDRLQPFLFSDIGHATSQVLQAGTPPSATLASAGLGFHYTVDRFVVMNADYGWQLSRIPGGTHPGSRGDLSITVGY